MRNYLLILEWKNSYHTSKIYSTLLKKHYMISTKKQGLARQLI